MALRSVLTTGEWQHCAAHYSRAQHHYTGPNTLRRAPAARALQGTAPGSGSTAPRATAGHNGAARHTIALRRAPAARALQDNSTAPCARSPGTTEHFRVARALRKHTAHWSTHDMGTIQRAIH
jgi:hypothetical protein